MRHYYVTVKTQILITSNSDSVEQLVLTASSHIVTIEKTGSKSQPETVFVERLHRNFVVAFSANHDILGQLYGYFGQILPWQLNRHGLVSTGL